jgi:hypothetical protein
MAPKENKEKKQQEDELVDFYKTLPKGMVRQYHNPHYDKHKLQVPFYAGIFGGTGAGKTQTLLNIIKKMSGTFEKIILCVKNADEPLYKWLKSKIPPQQLEVYENGVVPDVDKYKDFNGQMLVIFDDLVGVKKQDPIVEWYIRGRKIAGGCSMIYLSQSFYKTPKMVRIQMNHIFLKRLTSTRDLNLVMGEYGLLGNKKEIIKMYKDITSESKVPFLLIRTDAEPDERFSKNFLGFIKIHEDH